MRVIVKLAVFEDIYIPGDTKICKNLENFVPQKFYVYGTYVAATW